MSRLVVLLAHGSPDPRSSQAAASVVTRLEARLADERTVVRIAYLQHNWPTLSAALGRDLDSGAITEVHVQPLILTEATHAVRDIPEAIARAERDHRISLEVGDTIGMDPRLSPSLDACIPAGAPVVLAWAGGRTPQAFASTKSLAERWSADSGRQISLAVATESGESVVDAARALQSSAGRTPVVATFTLFPGVLADHISTAAARAGTRATPPLCELPDLIDILDQRLGAKTA